MGSEVVPWWRLEMMMRAGVGGFACVCVEFPIPWLVEVFFFHY